MALFDGLLGGGGSDPMDIYGDLFTEKQRAALRDQQMTQGLLNAAAVFSKAGQASRLPVSIPWGEAAQALGGTGDEAMNRMLKGMQVAEEVRSSRQKRGFADQVAKFAQGLLEQEETLGLPQGTLVKPYLAATGGATGGAPPSNAPPPPPGYQYPDMGDVPAKPMAAPTATDAGDYLPGKAAGLLNPAAYGGSGGGLPGQGVLTSLGGGEAGVPLPFGQGSPGSPDLSNIKIEQLSGEAAPAGGNWERDRALIRKYESGGRNIEQQAIGPQGGYNPSVGRVTGPSSASGYYQMIDPTWRAAAAKAGIDTSQYPRAINAPEALQDKAAEALYREQGLAPWAPYNSRLAAAADYQGGGFSGRIEQLGGEAAPAGAAPAGKIPGLNISPQGLAALNMLSKLGGLGEPFGSLLETYYKSPEYLRQSEQVKKDVELETQPKIEAEKARATQQYIQANDKFKSDQEIAKELITKGGLVQQPDGTYKTITSIQEGLAAVDNAKQTSDQKEYKQTYVPQELGAGRIPKSFEQWDINRRRAPSAAETQETALFKARVEIDKTVALDAAKKASLANDSLPVIDEMIRLADKTPGGWAGQMAANTAKAFSALGIPVTEGMSNAEAMQALTQRMIPPLRDPGSTSDKDMSLYIAASPGLAQSVEGRLKIAAMMRAIAQRNIETADVYHETIGLPASERRAKISALNARPLFSDEQRAALEGAARIPATAAPSVPTTPGAITTPWGTVTPIAPSAPGTISPIPPR